MLFTGTDLSYSKDVNSFAQKRGNIVDRNGNILASSYLIPVLVAHPNEITDQSFVAEYLANLFPTTSKESLLKLFSDKGTEVEVYRGLSTAEITSVYKNKLSGLEVRMQEKRIYEKPELFYSLLGDVSSKGGPLTGLEIAMEKSLSAGDDVKLSIDMRVQEILLTSLNRQIERFEASGGSAIILNVETGEIIASVSSDPNFAGALSKNYEGGSTLKVLNAAIALETGSINDGDEFDVSKPLRIGRYTIRDYWLQERKLSVPEVVLHSSNIGSAKIAAKIPLETQIKYLAALGLTEKLILEHPLTSEPLLPEHFNNLTKTTISYGHGISFPIVNLTSAFATAGGTGSQIRPTFLRRTAKLNVKPNQLFSEETVEKVRKMLRWNVIHSDGTANFADAVGYGVGAKTGTASRMVDGEWVNDTIISGLFPIESPKYAFTFVIEEPKGQTFSYGYATSGWVTAPLVEKTINLVAPILGIEKAAAPSFDEFANGAQRLQFSNRQEPIIERAAEIAANNQFVQKMNLAMALQYGPLSQRNYQKAFEIYEEILSAGVYTPAMVQLGILYKEGLGVQGDLNKSLSYFNRVLELEQNNVLANFHSADFFLYGLSVESDVNEAIVRYSISANKGETRAAIKLADIYEFGMGVKANKTKSIKWLEVAAQSSPKGNHPYLEEKRSHALRLAKSRLHAININAVSPSENRISGRNVALLIGTEKYRSFANLKTPANDVAAVGRVLSEEFGYEIKKLINPNRKTITTTLNSLVRELHPEDNLIIFYAGHGIEVGGDGFWIPSDAEKNDDTNWISNDYITRKLKNFRPRNILVISDSCYSGTLSRGIRFAKSEADKDVPIDSISAYLRTKSRIVITSGNLEPVLDGGGGKNSVFARALIEVLKKVEDTATATSLFSTLSPMVIEDSISLGYEQQPTIAGLNQAGHLGPDYVFTRN